ncbi:hypothetical protein KSP39_PZI017002 [Platanthera zijinensis]|uniref:Uncharacterized protein n=1 Tax=Platanthera zijinensis TaxID=2320716 RepID=A0AAP0B8C5_9ASPA
MQRFAGGSGLPEFGLDGGGRLEYLWQPANYLQQVPTVPASTMNVSLDLAHAISEVDRYLLLQREQLKAALQQQWKRDLSSLALNLRAKFAMVVLQKDKDLAEAKKGASELIQLLKKVAAEKDSWEKIARKMSATIAALVLNQTTTVTPPHHNNNICIPCGQLSSTAPSVEEEFSISSKCNCSSPISVNDTVFSVSEVLRRIRFFFVMDILRRCFSAKRSWRKGFPLPASRHGQICAPFSCAVLPDSVDRNSEAFARNSAAAESLLSQLRSHVQKVLDGGGSEAVRRNRSRNKLLPRERIDRVIDHGSSFLELSQVCLIPICSLVSHKVVSDCLHG